MTNKTQIMKHIDVLELIRIHVFRIPNTPRFEVEIESIDKNKNVVFDEDALRIMNQKITERAAQFEARDPRAKTYIEEFIARLTSELHRNGLMELEEISDEPSDPYADLRKQYK
jgi:hypothetical protein